MVVGKSKVLKQCMTFDCSIINTFIIYVVFKKARHHNYFVIALIGKLRVKIEFRRETNFMGSFCLDFIQTLFDELFFKLGYKSDR